MGFIKDVARLAKYTVANAAVRAKNFNEWLTRDYVSWQPTGTAPHRVNMNMQSLVEREDTNLATAVRIITDALAWLPIRVMEIGTDADGNETLQPDHDHPFNELWRTPNYHHTTAEIKKHFIGATLLTGNGYATIEQPAVGKHELWPVAAGQMNVKLDKKNRPASYVQTVGPDSIPWKTDEVIHMRTYNWNDPVYGASGLEPLKRQLFTEYQAELMTLGFFQNDGTPRAVLVPKESVGLEQSKQIEEFYKNRANPDDKNRLQIAPVDGTFHTVTPSMTDMEFTDMRKYHRERTFGLIGIPPFLGGVMEYANYANALIQEASFWRNTMVPLSNTFCDFLTRQLLERLFGPGWKLAPDLSGVEALQPDQVKKASKNRILVTSGIFTANEARADYNKEPLDGGDELRVMPVGGMTGGVQANADTAPKWALEPTVQVVTKSATGQVIGTKAVDTSVLVATWKSFDDTVQKYEPVLEQALKKWWKAQAVRVVDTMRDLSVEGRAMSNLLPYIRTKQNGHLDFFLELDVEAELMAELFEPIITEIYEKIGNEQSGIAQSRSPSGVGVAFDIDNPKVKVVISQLTNRITNTNDTTFKEIRKLIKRGFDEGLSVDTVAMSIHKKFREYAVWRSKLIARTEMTGIANNASMQAWSAWNATHKTWIATLDSLTRDYHVMYHGERVAINDYFKFGPEPLQCPGDANAQLAANVCNCRCSLHFDFEPLTPAELSDLEIQGLDVPGTGMFYGN